MISTKDRLTGMFLRAMGFQEIDHTADHALKVFGADLEELFISAAEGMTSLIVSDLKSVPSDITKAIALNAIDTESLLVEWLSELAYWAETEMLIFKTFRVQSITASHLTASVTGGKMPALEKYIKAVTYHNLEILKTPRGFEVAIVFDV